MSNGTVVSLIILSVALITGSDAAGDGTAAAQLSNPAEPGSTLVLYSDARVAYDLGNELEYLNLLLRRVAPRLVHVPLLQAAPEQVQAAQRIVVFCPQPHPVLPTNLLQLLGPGSVPILWVGYGVAELTQYPTLAGRLDVQPGTDPHLERVLYRGSEWAVDEASWIPMRLAATAEADVRMSVPEKAPATGLALCWRQGKVTIFSAVPTPGLLAFLFGDLLLDFYGVTEVAPARVLLRIDDYQVESDHRDFRRKVDFLARRGCSFGISITPFWTKSPEGVVVNLDAAPEFVNNLRYAQARGGRLLLRGLVREPGDRAEFWDTDLDRPGTNTPPRVQRGLQEALGLMLKHGLLPIGWQTPQDAAPRAVSQEVGRVFSTVVERPQLNDLSQYEKALLPAITFDREGRRIVPENLGFVPISATNSLEGISNRADFISKLRGTVAGVRFHAYVPQPRLTSLMAVLGRLNKPFLDLADLDNWVHVPGRVLLTGQAQRSVRLAGGVITWRAYDSRGKQVFTEQEFSPPGDRLLKRKGKGQFELYEFAEVRP